jgi:HEAT repeat protein
MPRRSFAWLTLLLFAGTGLALAEIQPDFLMDSDPAFRLADRVKNFKRDFVGLWIQALERPDVDLQRMTAETIALAHKHGVPDLNEAIPALETILVAESSHPAARFAAARALTALESRGSAEKMFDASQKFGSDLRQLVEPVLAKWDFAPIRPIWITRLGATAIRQRELVLAIRGLAQVQEVTALQPLLRIALDLVRTPDLRLEAAAAAGQLANHGLDIDADRLSRETRTPHLVNQLCAVRLLARHDDEFSRRLLIGLATDAESSIAAAALGRLNQINPELVLPLAEQAMQRTDQHVREQGAVAYLALPTPDRIPPLARLLDDPHPAVRRQLREGLYLLTQRPELIDPVRAAAMDVLGRDGWRGQEQAALLLGALEHKPAASRFIELLESPRVEVSICAAWGLRKVADPQKIPAIVARIRQQTTLRKVQFVPGLDLQVAHLFEACGRMRVTEAEPLMLEYIPKQGVMGERSRSAAIWSLGWLHEGVPDGSIAVALIDRVMDFALIPPESDLVKQLSAVSLARMKSVDQAPVLRSLVVPKPLNSILGLAILWAVKELTGEELPTPPPEMVGQGVWFLEPLHTRDSLKR